MSPCASDGAGGRSARELMKMDVPLPELKEGEVLVKIARPRR